MKYINKDVFWAAMEREKVKSIAALAYISGLSQFPLQRMINADAQFRISTLFSIAEALDVNPGDLLLDRKEMGDYE